MSNKTVRMCVGLRHGDLVHRQRSYLLELDVFPKTLLPLNIFITNSIFIALYLGQQTSMLCRL